MTKVKKDRLKIESQTAFALSVSYTHLAHFVFIMHWLKNLTGN